MYQKFARLGKCFLTQRCLNLRGETTIFAPPFRFKYIMALPIAWRYHKERCHDVLCTTKTKFWWQIKAGGIINHLIAHLRVHDLLYPRLGKPRRGLQIMDTRMGFPCPFRNVVIDYINLIRAIRTSQILIDWSLFLTNTLHDLNFTNMKNSNIACAVSF